MREAGKVCAEIFKGLEDLIKPGITTKDIDDYVESVTEKHGMRAAEKGYCGYPASVCTSVNDEVVHGIPSRKRKLQEGDIVRDDEARRLMETAEKAFFEGIKYAKVGYRLRDVSKAVQKTVEGEGFGVIRDFVGHGIGTEMHEDPQIPNYVCPGPNPRLQKGMTLCIEPMITEGDWEVEILDDDWTAVTTDGGWAAHYENTIVITDGEPEIITL